MARVSEITSGVQYQYSGEAGGVAASTTRVFKILKAAASEYVDVFTLCGIRIGDQHPSEQNLYCASVNAQYDGESRMVVQATFNYRTTPIDNGGSGEDRNSFQPDVRPPEYSLSTSLYEAPAYVWEKLTGPTAQPNEGEVILKGYVGEPKNSAGDTYEGITKLVPITTITYKIFDTVDVSGLLPELGKINAPDGPLPVLIDTDYAAVRMVGLGRCNRHTVMFRGAQSSPTVESHGGVLWSGFTNTFEFTYKPNVVKDVRLAGTDYSGTIGWDIVVPLEGLNVRAHTPTPPDGGFFTAGERNDFGQPLALDESGAIINPVRLPDNTSPVGAGTRGDKMRACVLVASFGGGLAQRPSASPILLNENGTARSPGLRAILHRYRVHEELDFRATFPSRFFY